MGKKTINYVVLAMTENDLVDSPEDVKESVNIISMPLYSESPYSGSPNEWKPFPSCTKNNEIVSINDLFLEANELSEIKKLDVHFDFITDNLESLKDELYNLRKKPIIYVIDCFSLGSRSQSIKYIATKIDAWFTDVCCFILVCGNYSDDQRKKLRYKIKEHMDFIYKSGYDLLDNVLIKEISDEIQFKKDLIAVATELITREETETGKGGAPSEKPRESTKVIIVEVIGPDTAKNIEKAITKNPTIVTSVSEGVPR